MRIDGELVKSEAVDDSRAEELLESVLEVDLTELEIDVETLGDEVQLIPVNSEELRLSLRQRGSFDLDCRSCHDRDEVRDPFSDDRVAPIGCHELSLIIGQTSSSIGIEIGIQLNRGSPSSERSSGDSRQGRIIERDRLDSVRGRNGTHCRPSEQLPFSALRSDWSSVRSLEIESRVRRLGELGSSLTIDAFEKVRPSETLGNGPTSFREIVSARLTLSGPSRSVCVMRCGSRCPPDSLKLGR